MVVRHLVSSRLHDYLFLPLFLSLPAHLPFPYIWLATEEIDLEEDQFLHVERIQPVGEPCCYSLHHCDRCGEQVKRNFTF